MVTDASVQAALKTVRDPELHQDIVALNMVRGVDIQDGRVGVDVALTVAGCPLHQRITEDIQHAVGAVDGVQSVDVHLSVMTPEERKTAFARAFGSSARPTAEQPAAGSILSEDSPTTVIGVASGKGGVGKSTVTANLAVALAHLGRRVGVMDMDIYGFSQGRMFGMEGRAKVNREKKVIPWFSHNVHLVSMGMFVDEDQAVIWRGPMLGKMMQQFFSDVAWPELDVLLIDLPPGTGDVALDISQKIPKANLILVTTPQEVATHVARRAAEVSRRADQTVLGVIENMSYVRCPHGDRMEIFGHGGGKVLADALHVPLLGQIPLEPTIRISGDTGIPATLQDRESEAGQAFVQIGRKILNAV